jgi:2-polyprenyl-6-methoxyphenol hydroxylase-like FAD-dependent oxidoreductase
MAGDTGSESDCRNTKRVLTDDHHREQSILVVGDGLVAAATAAFLGEAGLQSVVAPTFERPQRGVRTLWEPGLELLARIGLRRPVERAGTQIERLRCRNGDQSWSSVDDTGRALVAVERDRLDNLLTRQGRDCITRAEEPVIAVEPAGSSVRATFEGRSTELFDTVVITTRALLPTRTHRLSGQSVHTWEFEWPPNTSAPTLPVEAWETHAAAFTVPVSGGTNVRIVSVDEVPPSAALSPDVLADRFHQLFDAAPIAHLDRQRLQYRKRARATPRSLSKNGIVLAGAGARANIPGDCLGPTLGIEDAWVLADSLAKGTGDTGSAIAEYEQRRRRRERAVVTAIADSGPVCHELPLSPALERLRARRRVVFGHVTGRSLPAFARGLSDGG